MTRCANCGSVRIQRCGSGTGTGDPTPICQECHCMTLTDRPSDGELLLEIRDSLREIQKTLAMLEERIP